MAGWHDRKREGAALSASASVSDKAGNSAIATVGGTKIDKTVPTVSTTLSGTAGQNGWYTSAVTATVTGSDSLSGVATTSYSVDGGPTPRFSLTLVN